MFQPLETETIGQSSAPLLILDIKTFLTAYIRKVVNGRECDILVLLDLIHNGASSSNDDLRKVIAKRYFRVVESKGSVAVDNKSGQGRNM